MSIAITQTAQAPFKANDAAIYHGKKAHVVSTPEHLNNPNNIIIIYDDEKKHIAVVPVKELKHL